MRVTVSKSYSDSDFIDFRFVDFFMLKKFKDLERRIDRKAFRNERRSDIFLGKSEYLNLTAFEKIQGRDNLISINHVMRHLQIRQHNKNPTSFSGYFKCSNLNITQNALANCNAKTCFRKGSIAQLAHRNEILMQSPSIMSEMYIFFFLPQVIHISLNYTSNQRINTVFQFMIHLLLTFTDSIRARYKLIIA